MEGSVDRILAIEPQQPVSCTGNPFSRKIFMSDSVSDALPPTPNGAAQALAIGAAALLVPTAAFLWWWVFGSDADWTSESTLVLVLGAIGVTSLVAVPVLAAGASKSLRWAKLAYVIGACFAISAIGLGMAQALLANESEDGSAGTASLSCPREPQAFGSVHTSRSRGQRA
jgi:hypothetical protein